MSNPRPLHLEHPLDIDEGRRAARRLAELRREAEDTLEQFVKDAAIAEARYREALAKAYIGMDGTAAERDARARALVTDSSIDRDIKTGMVRVATERLRGLEGERSMLKSLLDWSARIDEETRALHGAERQAA